HPPFPEGTLAQRLAMHQAKEPASIFADRKDAPAVLVDICRKMMAKKPEDRYQTSIDVAEALRGFLASRGRLSSETARALATAGSMGEGAATVRRRVGSAPPPRPVGRMPGERPSSDRQRGVGDT